jgi:hypothetical protein
MVAHNFDRGNKEFKLDPFLLSFLNFLRHRRHLGTRSTVKNHGFLAKTNPGSSCVYRSIAATDDQDTAANFGGFASVQLV